MADVKVGQEPNKPTQFYNLPQEPPTAFVDAWQPSTTLDTVKIRLGDIVDASGEQNVARLAFTVTMTHNSFLNFVDMLNTVADFLRTAYGGSPTTTANLPEDAQARLREKYGERI